MASNIGPSGLPPFQVFADDRAGIEAAINTIRTLLPVSLLRRFMDQLEQAEIVAQDEQKKLVLSKIAFRDWRALRQSDWDAERWEGEDQALTCLDRDDESYLAALRRRLARMGIVDVVVTDDVEYMGIAPA
ncbi:MAG TPA: hypothetical protein VND64_26310 [Pirellulales bacterium]|nr:hypothetical protein [Pirellulales bacterium]